MDAIGRRLAQPSVLCNGRIISSSLHTTLTDAEVHPSLFDARAAPSLWGTKPLLGSPRPGAIRLRCTPPDELSALRTAYAGLHYEPLVRTIRPHNGRRPFAPASRRRIALLVLPDYANFFHQAGSVVIAWAALLDASARAPLARTASPAAALPSPDEIELFFLNNASTAPTTLFWSPGLSAAPARYMRASPPPPAAFSARG